MFVFTLSPYQVPASLPRKETLPLHHWEKQEVRWEEQRVHGQ